jgi:hypothetical protein
VAAEFISEPIVPQRGSADASAMARGVHGLPSVFKWRDRRYAVRRVIESWMRSETEGHRPGGERYYRRHYYRIVVDTGEIMTIYAVRQLKPGESKRNRWQLYTIESNDANTP